MAQAVAPALSAEQVARIRAYRAQRLSIVRETEFRGGMSTIAGVRPLPTGMVLDPDVVIVDPLYTVQTWGIYRGESRLSPAEVLRVSGDTTRADSLTQKIERDDKKARRWLTVAGAGGVALAGGLVTQGQAKDLPHLVLGQQLTLGGMTVAVTGLIGASIPASRSSNLSHYPSAIMERAEAEALVERHNRALQESLGLTPEDLLFLEIANGM